MYRTGKWITKSRLWALLLFVVFISAGCGSRLGHNFLWWGQNPSGQLQARLDEGNRLFSEGDYSAAEVVYQELQETGNQEVIRPALYGLACSRFMLAENKQEYLEAIEVLELWQRISPGALDEEDPRMLLALFSKVHPGGQKGAPDNPQVSEDYFLMWFFDCEERIGELEDQIEGLKQEITAYEKQRNAVKEKEAANEAMEEALKEKEAMEQALKEKEGALASMAKELSKLRGQIKTLETIDQEIQEKKQGISSP